MTSHRGLGLGRQPASEGNTLSRISRFKTPISIVGAVLLTAGITAVALNMFVVQPRHDDEQGYKAAKAALSSSLKVNGAAQKTFTAELSTVKGLRTALTPLLSASKALFPAATFPLLSGDMKTLDQAVTSQAPAAAVDLPTEKMTYGQATTALNRITAGVRDDTTATNATTDGLRTVVSSVTADVRTVAAAAGTQAAVVLIANQGAGNAVQTAFATASVIDVNGDSTTIIGALNTYVAAGVEVIADNHAHPVPIAPVIKPAPKPVVVTPAVPATPAAAPTPAPTPTPQPTLTPVDHSPHVVATGEYVKACPGSAPLFTQSTKAGNTITLNESTPYTYSTTSTATGYSVAVSSCTQS